MDLVEFACIRCAVIAGSSDDSAKGSSAVEASYFDRVNSPVATRWKNSGRPGSL